MNTTVVKMLNGTHVGRTMTIPGRVGEDQYIVSITHKQDGHVVVRWGYLVRGTHVAKPYKKTFDVRYKPETELVLL